ncbi:MAG: SIS domain-containing protein [Candidatus Solibacter sp.]|nr:SIS domain-containing protein [Candidatus Solibacter sp.]
MPDDGSRLERMRATLLRESSILAGLAENLDAASAQAVDVLLETRGHVLVGGAGTSNAIAMRLAHLLCCCGVPAVFLHPSDSLHGSSGAVTGGHTVVLISKGGKTADVNRFARIARERGARIVAFTEDPSSELGQLADAVVTVKIPADSDPFGMVATSSSLANGAVADAICETILHEKEYSRESFARTHPGGAVGDRIEREGILK